MNDFRDDALEHQEVIALTSEGLVSQELRSNTNVFHFVVAAPQAQRCVMAQTFYILDKFLTDVRFKFTVSAHKLRTRT